MPVTDFAFDFRATAGFVTDPSYAAPVLGPGELYPHIYTNGNGDSITAGVFQNPTIVSAFDRNALNDARLSGVNLNNNGNNGAFPSFYSFVVTLPSSGKWSIQLACGDASNGQSQYINIVDGGVPVTIATYAGVATGANSFMDASGNVWPEATFFASQVPLVYDFASDGLLIQIGPDSQTGVASTCIAFLRITAVPAPPVPVTASILRWAHGGRMTPPYNP